MDTEPGAGRRDRVVDWLAAHPDLPHLFAHLSELVHVHGHAPGELVVLPGPRSTAGRPPRSPCGWAEAVSDELPRIRQEYEKRVADAYAQGQGDARGVRRPQRRTDALPGRRCQGHRTSLRLAPRTARGGGRGRGARPQGARDVRTAGRPRAPRRPRAAPRTRAAVRAAPGTRAAARARAGARAPQGVRIRAGAGPPGDRPGEPGPPQRPAGTEGRAPQGRPSRSSRRWPGSPAQVGPPVDRRDADPAEPESRASRGQRLSDRARALEKDMTAERTREEAPPEPPP